MQPDKLNPDHLRTMDRRKLISVIGKLEEKWRTAALERDRLLAIGDNVPYGALIQIAVDAEASAIAITNLSKTWNKLTGLSRKQTVKDASVFLEAVHPGDRPGLMAILRAAGPVHTAFRIYDRKKEVRWLQLSATRYRNGDKLMADGFISDITRQKYTEHQHIVEKERLKAIGDNLPNGVLIQVELDVKTRHLRLTYLSKSWEKITGLPAGKSLADISEVFGIIHPDDLPALKREIEKSAQYMSTLNTELRFYRKGYGIRWVHLSSHPHPENGKIVSDGIISDITGQKLLQQQQDSYRDELKDAVKISTQRLRESNEELQTANEEQMVLNEELQSINEELYGKNIRLEEEVELRNALMRELEHNREIVKNFIEQSLEGIVIINNEGRVIEWNRQQEKITGIARDAAIGQYEWELLAQYTRYADTKNFKSQLRKSRLSFLRNCKTQNSIAEERVFRMADGTDRYLFSSIFPIVLSGTCFIGIITHDITERKRINAELAQYRTQLEQMVEEKTRELSDSREQLVTLSNNLHGGIILQLVTKGGDISRMKVTFISETVTDLLGIAPGDILESSEQLFSLFPEDTRELFSAHFSGIDQDHMIRHESRIILASGETKWVHVRLVKHRQYEEKDVWEGFIIDITQHKLAELELEKIRIRQTYLIDVLKAIQFSARLDDAINLSLSKIGKFLGLSRVYTFVKTGSGDRLQNNYEWCNEGIAPQKGNLQNVSAEAVKDWFEVFDSDEYICTSDIRSLSPETYRVLAPQGIKAITVLPMVNNGVNYGFMGFEDCIAHRQWEQHEVDLLKDFARIISESILRCWAEGSLKRSRHTLRTVLDNINANIFVVDYETSEILFANKRVKQQLDDPAIEGKSCSQVNLNKNIPVCFCPNPDLLDEDKYPGRLLRREYRNPNTLNWYECVETAIEWITGNMVFMEFLTDITDRKNNEIELIRAKEKAEESDMLKSAFLANMSHEIRTPLNGINGFLNFLSDDKLSPARRLEYVNIIRNSSNQLVRIIDDIIDLSKIEARQMTIHPSPFRLNDLMNEIHVFFETYLETNGRNKIQLLTDKSGFADNPVIYADPVRLRQVLTNLINNAIKFTGKGYVQFGYRINEAGMLEFEVEDTGIGLDEKQINNVFDRFWQAERGGTRNYGGAGLGLTISKNLVQLMGGEINVSSTIDQGSTFCFTISYIPVSEDDEHLFTEEAATTGRQPDHPSVLFVEPGIMKYKYYEGLLSHSGIALFHATDAQQWLEQISRPVRIDMAFVNSEIFREINDGIISEIKSVRTNLPVIIIVNNGEENERWKLWFPHGEMIKEPLDYGKLYRIIATISG